MQLSLRLSAIAEMVMEGNRLVDVGCDHGYLPVYLVLTHRIPGAIAMDVRSGPLMRAREHIEEYGVGAYIETRLSDGLSALKKGEGDTLVIAGMGGPLMERILVQGKEIACSFKELILQPQSDIPHFRGFLLESGYEIISENMIFEDGKYYPMMKAVWKGLPQLPWTKEELYFGKFLLSRKNPVLKEYLKREKRIREEILKNLSNSSGEGGMRRMKEVEEEKRLIEEALKKYESDGTDKLA